MGVGETVKDSIEHPELTIRVKDLFSPVTLVRRLTDLYDLKLNDPELKYHIAADTLIIDNFVRESLKFVDSGVKITNYGALKMKDALADGSVVFEGAQGVLLDQDYGFHPHTTWSNCTFDNAFELLGDHRDEAKCLGIIRTFQTRHGAGPFPTEKDDLRRLAEYDHNQSHAWQGSFRVGHLDVPLTRYAIDVVGGVDGLVVTHVDRWERLKWPKMVCLGYPGMDDLVVKRPADLQFQEQLGQTIAKPAKGTRAIAMIDDWRNLSECFKAPVSVLSYGPAFHDKKEV